MCSVYNTSTSNASIFFKIKNSYSELSFYMVGTQQFYKSKTVYIRTTERLLATLQYFKTICRLLDTSRFIFMLGNTILISDNVRDDHGIKP